MADGLDLSPAEYAELLRQLTTGRDLPSDNYSLGGVVAEVEALFARLLGKEAAMFVPTGTLANHIAVRLLAGDARRVLVQADSHLYNDSGDCASTLSDLNLIPLAPGAVDLPLDDVKSWVARSAGGRVPTRIGAISIETPVRRLDHRFADWQQLVALSGYAREQGIGLHLDGSRLFTVPYHSGHGVAEYAALFDTVYVSLWKHFNGASGAILAGDARLIDGLYHTRRMFGGSLPFAWPLIAPVLRYAETFESDYAQSWQAADQLIELLHADGRFRFEKLPDGTTRLFMTVSGGDIETIRKRLPQRGLAFAPAGFAPGRFALQINPSILRQSPKQIARAFIDVVGGR